MVVAAGRITQCGPNKEPDVLLTDNTALWEDPGIFQASLLRVNSWDVKTSLNRFEICNDFLDCAEEFHSFALMLFDK